MAYSTVSVPRPVALTRVSGVADKSICWKDEAIGDEKKSEPADGRPTVILQGSTKASRPRRSGTDRGSRP